MEEYNMYLIDKLTNKKFCILSDDENDILIWIRIITMTYNDIIRFSDKKRIYHKELLQKILLKSDISDLDDTIYMEFLPNEMLCVNISNVYIEEKGTQTRAIMVDFYKDKI